MMPHSSTNEPLASGGERSPPTKQGYPDEIRAIPLPVITRTTSQTSSRSAASFSSTVELISNRDRRQNHRQSIRDKVRSWAWRSEKPLEGLDTNELGTSGEDGGLKSKSKLKKVKAWHGWRAILFDSWLNVFLLLIPTSWILKLATTNSDTLIFTSCMLAMIPLVKLHDLAISVMSKRIGGSKTGLLNASFSNTVELVVAITALYKCELRVVQSSLIGSILSKLLLILGMCFFAGGMRFSHQDFDSTATQIHSSLLSISVGALCLPAAFHFALSYKSEDLEAAGSSLDQQKEDLLKMSHSVSFLLLLIYVSYLLFQLWSHTHLYQDSAKPSDKLPVAVSLYSVTSRVRRKSSSLRGHRSQSQSTLGTVRSKQYLTIPPTNEFGAREPSKTSPVEEVPETTYESVAGDGNIYSSLPLGSSEKLGLRERTAYLMSPFGTTSQVTLTTKEVNANAAAQPDPTVRLVRNTQRDRGRSVSETNSMRSVSSGSSSASSSEEDDRVTEVLSAYTGDRGEVVRPQVSGSESKLRGCMSSDVREARERRGSDADSANGTALEEEEPELSWTMTLLTLTIVAMLVTINSEWLVDSMDSLSPTLSKEWIGLVLLPVVSSIAECVTAVNVSVKDQLTLSISVAVGSTIQTALFVIPSMVLLGWVLNKPLALLFDPFETVVLYISVHIMGYVVADGKSNWLEGVILICLYFVIAVTFWFYPGSSFSSNLAVCVDTPAKPVITS